MELIQHTQIVPGKKQDLLNILFLVCLAFILLFLRLGERGLADPEEGRYGEIAREMSQSGDLITPRLNYLKRFHKPPLIFWATAASINSFSLIARTEPRTIRAKRE